MNRKSLLGFVLLILTTLCAAQPGDGVSVTKELESYYEQGTLLPWQAAIKALTAEIAQERDKAAKYLVSLLGQAQADESSGKAPWGQTPYWGRGSENPARNLRKSIAEKLANAPSSSAALAVLRWYLEQEKYPEFQTIAVAALAKAQGKEADEICLSVLKRPHESGIVLLAALKSIGDRKADLSNAVLNDLCHHYRSRIRMAARKLNEERGNADPGAFDPVAALKRPALSALMTKIGALLDQPAPSDAPFVKVTTTQKPRKADKEYETVTTLGWLVKNDGDSWVVSTPSGRRESFQKESVTNSRFLGEVVVKSRFEKVSVAEEVKRVVELRQKGESAFDLSQSRRREGQNQERGTSVYEVTLAHWLYTAKEHGLSAQVLLPALDTVYMDYFIVEMMRHRLGDATGYRMLVAFAGDRNFPETRRLAELMVNRYAETRFHGYAVALSKEIPKRLDDFKKLKLPTPQEWASLKMKVSRAEQITFLAERLRLLNCFQWEQPGSYLLGEVQFAEQRGMEPDATSGGKGGTTKVINPFLELAGGTEVNFDSGDRKPIKGMGLTVADIPLLAPFLRDEWHILCVSYHRDFFPDRILGTTRSLMEPIINNLAKHDLCQTWAMAKMTNQEIDKHIEGMINWAKANTNKGEQDLVFEALDKEIKAGAFFGDLPDFELLVELKDERLRPVLTEYLNNFGKKGSRPNPNELKLQGFDVSASSSHLRQLLDVCLRYDARAFKEPAREFAAHKNPEIRLFVGQILFEAGEIAEGRKILVEVLENCDPRQIRVRVLPRLAATLLKEGSSGSRDAARLIFKSRLFAGMDDGTARAALVKQCAEGGIGEGYLSYLPRLDGKHPTRGNVVDDRGKATSERCAAEIVTLLAPNDPEIMRIVKEFPRSADQIAPLKEWLKAKAKSVEKTPEK